MGEASCLFQLGSVSYERFLDARGANFQPKEATGHLSQAEKYSKQALAMFPTSAVQELAATHNQLGLVYANSGQTDTALHHYQNSIRYSETMQDRFGTGLPRYNAAITLYLGHVSQLTA
jgi:tetratricopeptide (TPR) repeat protein